MKISKILYLIGLLLTFSKVQADTTIVPSSVILYQTVNVSFVPDDAFLFVDFGSSDTKCFRGVLIPPSGDESKKAQPGTWLVGARVSVPREQSVVTFSTILVGKDNNYAFVPPSRWDLKTKETFAGSNELIREKLLDRKKVLQSWKVQVDAQTSSLQRLRKDAEVIANVGKIIEVKEENERANSDIEAIQKDIDNLKHSLTIVKSFPAPKNFSKRELELTEQLAQLADSARAAESNEFNRRTIAENALQKNLALLEATRDANPAELEQQLANLIAERQKLEAESANASSN